VEAAIGIEPMNKGFAVLLRVSLRLVTFVYVLFYRHYPLAV